MLPSRSCARASRSSGCSLRRIALESRPARRHLQRTDPKATPSDDAYLRPERIEDGEDNGRGKDSARSIQGRAKRTHYGSGTVPTAGQARGGMELKFPQELSPSPLVFRRNLHTKREATEQNAIQMLRQRGLIKDVAGDEELLAKLMTEGKMSIYCGIDPTAPSMHLGHLIPLNTLIWLYCCGHTVCSLVGSFTATIGDPTDRLEARNKMDTEHRSRNASAMEQQLSKIWSNVDAILEENPERRINSGVTDGGWDAAHGPRRSIDFNSRWSSKLTLHEWLTTVGQCAKLGAMLSRDTVKNRLSQGKSMTLAEFQYPFLQAYDWYFMCKERRVEVQVGGSDQYGNIVSGMDLIKHMWSNHRDEFGTTDANQRPPEPFGITTPLLTTSHGSKFGKSAGNAVWFDESMTNPVDLYGHLLRTSDHDVEQHLKMLTTVPIAEIKSVMVEQHRDASKRPAQKLLALEVLRIAYGTSKAVAVRKTHEDSRNPSLVLQRPTGHQAESSSTAAQATKARTILPRGLVESSTLQSMLLYIGMDASKSKCKDIIREGGLYMAKKTGSNDNVQVAFQQVDRAAKGMTLDEWLIDGNTLLLRRGKWKTYEVEVMNDDDFLQKGLTIERCPDWQDIVKKTIGSGAA